MTAQRADNDGPISPAPVQEVGLVDGAGKDNYNAGAGHAACRIYGCDKPLGATTYSFGDGLGNAYRKCGRGHWTPKPPPPDLAAIEACDEDD